ncbi:OmpH family outer membrane protein [Calidithermus timidus]|jgi:outer membrane protein|uniref:OmpH family outer membrane protein n=1 Tax=Calidithermus timidus TaxID=307124 RepID=UPI00035D3805|nr:OmpH family outer membrane protein [Calidithermus timidus]
MWTRVLAALCLVLLTAPLSAQTKPQPWRVGFISPDIAIQAHPNYAKLKAVQDQAEKELKPLRDQISQLSQKARGGPLSAKDQQSLQTLQKALQDGGKKWSERISAVAKPLLDDIDKEVRKVAQANGFQVVMDYKVAQASGIVVYAAPGTDVTTLVVKELKK